MVQEGKGGDSFASDELQLMVTPCCCMLYIGNPLPEGQIHSKTGGPVHDGSWSLVGFRVWGPCSKCPSHPTVLSLTWRQGFHNDNNPVKSVLLVTWQAKGQLANISRP